MLWRSLMSCKDFIHTFLALPNDNLFYLTAFIYPRLCYVFITLAKLVFVESDGRGTNRSDQSEDIGHFQSSAWATLNVAKEADFLHLGKQILDKFSAVAVDYAGADGERDAMSNLAAAMTILMAGYEQQTNEEHRASNGAELVDSAAGMVPEHADGAVDFTAFQPGQMGNAGGGGALDTMFEWESPTRTAWDDMLESFSMSPFS